MKNKHKIQDSWVKETERQDQRGVHRRMQVNAYISVTDFGSIFLDVHCIMKINKYKINYIKIGTGQSNDFYMS